MRQLDGAELDVDQPLDLLQLFACFGSAAKNRLDLGSETVQLRPGQGDWHVLGVC